MMINSENGFKITFKVPDVKEKTCLWSIDKNGVSALSAHYDNGFIMILSRFDVSDDALLLTGEVKPASTVSYVFRPYRLELWIDGALVDENWQFGALMCDISDIEAFCEKNKMTLGEVEDEEKEPTVVGSFTGAYGWRPADNVFVGDCMPFEWEGRYHVLYLKDRRHHCSKWTRGAHQWSHISSADLVHWDIHPMAVPVSDASEGSICTGSWIVKDGVHRLYYAVRQNDWGPAPLRRSTSTDGYHYEKDPALDHYLSDRYLVRTARDPKIIFGADGKWHMLVTTTDLSVGMGCLAHLVSDDEKTWTELEPEFVGDTPDEPECPDYFFYKGKYYMLYSIKGKAHYKYSTEPFGAWITPAEPVIECGNVPKCAVWHDRLIFTGFDPVGGYAGNMIFVEAYTDEKGELHTKPVPEMSV
jgi:hypothetical protein